jgi:hypothetical protein
MAESMKAFVERQNVVHYIDLLKTETDPVKREALSRLLAQAGAKQEKVIEKK